MGKERPSSRTWKMTGGDGSGKVLVGAILGALVTVMVLPGLQRRGAGGLGGALPVMLSPAGADGGAPPQLVLRRQFSSSGAAGGAGAGDGWVMPMVRPGNLTTAELLDANPGLTGAETRRLMMLHQQLFCRDGSPDVDIRNSSRVARLKLPKFGIYAYHGNDIVSNHLKGGGWEKEEIDQMLWALAAKVPPPGTPAQGDLPPVSSWAPPARPLMVDVGANIGWFTMNAAAAGADVVAFEAMSENALLVRTTLCENPKLMEHVSLFATGLGTKRSTCHMISGDGNVGDGFSICDRDPQEDIKRHAKGGEVYLLRGQMTTMRMDSLLDDDVQILKMDIEGFELEALRGASGLMRRHNVWLMMVECNVGMIGEGKKNDMLGFLDEMGYAISNTGFKGPWISEEQINKGTAKLAGVNLFLMKKKMKAALEKH
ncbi:MAG: S-adenosyl-L-methionine-dependent methyltransferase [Monoraphidium minutum]|nr:MAG: S-adenosyl-L-methionine-dependent methyltransferase [Monoraphidium minutum]